jgi:uncharacterized secreted protein with C-terminal beta-propeller domain
MGEYNGYLRIGTTRGGWWGEAVSNQLAVLGEQGGTLVETGKLEGIAPGERIYSMRFDGNKGYMVTFRQTDPLFTFNLSNPAKPLIAGEIKVSGFATYIHLLGQDGSRLLTVGRSADATGRVTGNKLQLFDVSNSSSPVLIGDYELGEGWSSALYDHHAFLYYEPFSLLALPYSSYTYGSASNGSWLKLFRIEQGGITYRGMIPAPSSSNQYGYGTDTFDRSAVIGNYIYAVAGQSAVVADSDTLSIEAQVLFSPSLYPY